MSTPIKYYHYLYTETDLGYEVKNIRNNKEYFVTHTEQKGWSCNCNGRLLGNIEECKHIKNVKELFDIQK